MEVKFFKEWIAEQIRLMCPYAKTIVAVDWYWGTGDGTDMCVSFSRKVNGYDSWHFTESSLAEHYKAHKVTFKSDGSIVITF